MELKQKVLRKFLLVGAVGNLICWFADILLGGQNGFSVNTSWIDMPSWRFSLSGILGSIAMVLVLIGFWGLYKVMKCNFPMLSFGVLFGGLLACIPGAVFHFICTTAAWFYANMRGTLDAENIIAEFFLSHIIIIALSFSGIIIVSIVLFICIISGKSIFPRWAVIFNILFIQIIGGFISSFYTIIGVSNIGGIFMFIGLYIMLSMNIPKANLS